MYVRAPSLSGGSAALVRDCCGRKQPKTPITIAGIRLVFLSVVKGLVQARDPNSLLVPAPNYTQSHLQVQKSSPSHPWHAPLSPSVHLHRFHFGYARGTSFYLALALKLPALSQEAHDEADFGEPWRFLYVHHKHSV